MTKTTTSNIVTTETQVEFTLVISRLTHIECHKVVAVRSWHNDKYNGSNPKCAYGIEYQLPDGKLVVAADNDYLWWSVL